MQLKLFLFVLLAVKGDLDELMPEDLWAEAAGQQEGRAGSQIHSQPTSMNPPPPYNAPGPSQLGAPGVPGGAFAAFAPYRSQQEGFPLPPWNIGMVHRLLAFSCLIATALALSKL